MNVSKPAPQAKTALLLDSRAVPITEFTKGLAPALNRGQTTSEFASHLRTLSKGCNEFFAGKKFIS
jgi:hypothetical protein